MIYVGLDQGYGYTKTAWQGKDGFVHEWIMPSIWGTPRETNLPYEASDPLDALHVSVDGQERFLGFMAQRLATDASYILDKDKTEAAAFFTHALCGQIAAQTRDNILGICTGPAISDYKKQKDVLAERIRNLHSVEIKAGKFKGFKEVIHVHPVILPQGAGALLSGEYLKPGETVALLDIGFGTVGHLVFEWRPNEPRPTYIDRLSGSLRLGMHVAQKNVQKQVNEAYGVDLLLSQMEDVMRAKYIKEVGRDITNIVEEEYQIQAKQITENLKPIWGQAGGFDKLLIGGGGAIDLTNYIQAIWPKARQIYKPQAANALGSLSAAIAEFSRHGA